MELLGLIAGGGAYPLLLARAARARGVRLPAGFFRAHPEFTGKVQLLDLDPPKFCRIAGAGRPPRRAAIERAVTGRKAMFSSVADFGLPWRRILSTGRLPSDP